MRMQARYLKYLRTLLVFVLIFPTASIALQSSLGMLIEPTHNQKISKSSTIMNDENPDVPIAFDVNLPNQVVALSDTSGTSLAAFGIMNPIQVEQSGYSTNGNISGRTDTMENTEQILTIDTDHDWIASSADVNLWNLKKVYAENGTYGDGYPGVNINPTGKMIDR